MNTRPEKYDLDDRLIDFAVRAIDIAEALPPNRTGNHIANQLIRSSTSPAPNHAEAQGAESRRDFIHKMRIAFKELRETRIWIKIIRRKQYIKDKNVLESCLKECEELIRIFGKSIKTAESNTET